MSVRMILTCALFLLLLTVPTLAQNNDGMSIFEALQLAEKAEMGSFTSAENVAGFWAIKGSNLQNTLLCELLINSKTGLIVSAKNITLKEIVLRDNTYEYSGIIYPYNDYFYKTDLIYNGFEIYQNDSRYFKIKQAIFLRDEEGFVAYFMTKGPDKTK